MYSVVQFTIPLGLECLFADFTGKESFLIVINHVCFKVVLLVNNFFTFLTSKDLLLLHDDFFFYKRSQVDI